VVSALQVREMYAFSLACAVERLDLELEVRRPRCLLRGALPHQP
jgi:hypothetical protein